jgi:hypothetical protein
MFNHKITDQQQQVQSQPQSQSESPSSPSSDSILYSSILIEHTNSLKTSLHQLLNLLQTGMVDQQITQLINPFTSDTIFDTYYHLVQSISSSSSYLMCPMFARQYNIVQYLQMGEANQWASNIWNTLQCDQLNDISMFIASMNWKRWANVDYVGWKLNSKFDLIDLDPPKIIDINGHFIDPVGFTPRNSPYGQRGILASKHFNQTGICGVDGFICVIAFSMYGIDPR